MRTGSLKADKCSFFYPIYVRVLDYLEPSLGMSIKGVPNDGQAFDYGGSASL